MEADERRRSHAAPRRHASPGGPNDGVVVRAKCAAAAAIGATLAARGLTMRAAAVELHVDAADVQRIRNGEVDRFTLDRLVRIAARPGHRVELHLVPPAGPRTGT